MVCSLALGIEFDSFLVPIIDLLTNEEYVTDKNNDPSK